jgi:hypothetical protein
MVDELLVVSTKQRFLSSISSEDVKEDRLRRVDALSSSSVFHFGWGFVLANVSVAGVEDERAGST